jgi:hypothetical protein
MQKTAFILALAISTIASATDFSRCGKDQFGNIVCQDKDGVLTTTSRSPEAGDRNDAAASGVSATEAKARRDEINEKLRCGIDPFGNKVCR